MRGVANLSGSVRRASVPLAALFQEASGTLALRTDLSAEADGPRPAVKQGDVRDLSKSCVEDGRLKELGKGRNAMNGRLLGEIGVAALQGK